MRLLRSAFGIVLLLLSFGASDLNAARDQTAPAAGPRFEVLVLEVRNCSYCSLVRERVQPLYEQSAHARSVPLRYVDITRIDELKLGLRERITTVPTIVLLQDGAEVDRITGYMGPDVTLRALSHMIANAE